MSKQTQAATLEPPASPVDRPMKIIKIVDPSGVILSDPHGGVFGHRTLARGWTVALPEPWADELIATGRAIAPIKFRFVALASFVFGTIVCQRGVIYETDFSPSVPPGPGASPDALARNGLWLALAPGEVPPAPLPMDPITAARWEKGPLIRVRATAAGAFGRHGRKAAGDIIEGHEDDMLLLVACRQPVEVIDPISDVGKAWLALQERTDGARTKSYEELARDARKEGTGRGGPGGPPVVVRARFGGFLCGAERKPREEFEISEREAGPALAQNKIELVSRWSDRLNRYVRKIVEFGRSQGRNDPPTY